MRLCLLWLSMLMALTQWIVVDTKFETNQWLIKREVILDQVEKNLISSVERILLCLDRAGPLQVTFALPEKPSPWSIAAAAHAANLPVMMDPHPWNPSRGFVNVLTLREGRISPEHLAKCLSSVLSTDVQGYFLIVHLDNVSTRDFFQGSYSAFYHHLGTTRVLHLSPNSDPYVYFAKPYDSERKLWPDVEKSVVDFCRDQRHERSRHLRLSNGVENLKGFRFSFIIREQHMWLDRRGETRFGGRDYQFAKMLLQLGMRQEVFHSDSGILAFKERRVEVILPVTKVTIFNLELSKRYAELTVSALQGDEHLVVRRAQRMPFGLVLLLPFRWQTWFSIGAMVALMVVACTLVRTHQVNFVDVANGALDVLEMVLTGGTSRRIPLLSHKLVFVCGFLMWLVAANAYTGLLLGFLTVPRYFNELNTIDEVVQTTDRLYVQNDVYLNFMAKMISNLGKLAKNVTPILHIHERDLCVQDIVETGNAATWMSSHLFSIVSRYRKYTKDGQKLLHIVKEPIDPTCLYTYLVRRNHRILYVLNSLILRLMESGLSDHWDRMLEYSLDLDGQGEKSIFRGDAKPEKLKIVQFTGHFALYGIGLSLAGITFIVEQILGSGWVRRYCWAIIFMKRCHSVQCSQWLKKVLKKPYKS